LACDFGLPVGDSRRRRIALPMFTDFVLLDWAEL